MRFLILPLLFFLSTYAHAELQFNESEMASCIANLVVTNHSSENIQNRLKFADNLRVVGASGVLDGDENESHTSSALLNILIPFSKQDLYEVMAFHSSPLIDYEKYNWGKGLFHNDTLERLKLLYIEKSDSSVDLTVMPNFKDHLDEQVPPLEREAFIDMEGRNNIFVKMMLTTNGVAENLVSHLIEVNEKDSITHFELIKKAVEIYDGDVFTALAVIGYIFDIERNRVSHRSKKLYLGSRIQPLLVNDRTDVLGDNYHFWMYLNAALQGKGKVARRMSLTYEGSTGDLRDMKADSAGIEVGTTVRKYITQNKPIPDCNL